MLGCVVGVDSQAQIVREEKRFSVDGAPDLRLTTFDGAIEVRGTDSPQVLVEIEKRGPTREAVDELRVEATQEGRRIDVEVKRPSREKLGTLSSAGSCVIRRRPVPSEPIAQMSTRPRESCESNTIVGDMLERGRLPGSTLLAAAPTRPNALGTPGARAKSSISLLSTTPVPGTTTFEPKEVLMVAVMATIAVGHAILTEAALSFLGLGIQPPTSSWGAMMRNGFSYMERAPWLAAFTGLSILLTVLALNLAGDVLRDRLDPRGESRR